MVQLRSGSGAVRICSGPSSSELHSKNKGILLTTVTGPGFSSRRVPALLSCLEFHTIGRELVGSTIVRAPGAPGDAEEQLFLFAEQLSVRRTVVQPQLGKQSPGIPGSTGSSTGSFTDMGSGSRDESLMAIRRHQTWDQAHDRSWPLDIQPDSKTSMAIRMPRCWTAFRHLGSASWRPPSGSPLHRMPRHRVWGSFWTRRPE